MSLHEVIRATLSCGAKYAIDPTGLQMGWKHSIMPWEVYYTQRIHRVESTEAVTPKLPGYTIITNILQRGETSDAVQSPRAALVETVAHMVNKLLNLRGPQSGVGQLLQLKETDFCTCRTSIVASFKRGLDCAVQYHNAGAKHTAVLPPLFDALSVTSFPKLCQSIDMLWYTDQDFAAAGGNMMVVQDVVRRRWHQLLDLGQLPGLDGVM